MGKPSLLLVPLVLAVSLTTHSVASADVADDSFSVFAVGDYLYQNKLSNSDAWVFRDRLIQRGWTKDTELYQGDVSGSSMASNGKYSDMIYFTGHGASDGALMMRNNSLVYWYTIGDQWKGLEYAEDQDVEWVVLAACHVLIRNGWGKVLNNGAHHVFGYRNLSDDITDDYIAEGFIGEMYPNYMGAYEKMITAWQWANAAFSEYDWAVTGHKGNENDSIHGVGSGATADISGTSDIYHWYQGGSFYLNMNTFTGEETTVGRTKLGKSKQLGTVSVENEKLNYQQLAKDLVGDFEVFPSESYRAVSYGNQQSTLTVYPSGSILYSRERSYEPVQFNKEDAMAQADKFVQKHGGMPKDAKVTSVHSFMGQHVQSGMEYVNGYMITYGHEIEGVQIDGKAGDSIKVFLDSTGVPFYQRTWREFKNKVPNTEQNPISADQALDKAKQAMPQRFKADVLPEPDKVELVYWSMPFTAIQSNMYPVWKVSIGTDALYIDAKTGNVINEAAYLPDLKKDQQQ